MGLLDNLKDAVKGKLHHDGPSQDCASGSGEGPIPSIPPGKHGDWRFVAEVSDEFKGNSLDTSKWDPFNKNWKGRAPGWFNKDNVAVGDGCAQLTCRAQDPPDGYPEQYHTFSTAFLRSKAQVKYGYFEALVQPSDSMTSSAWWFVHNERETWNEIDVFEVSQACGHERKFHTNTHVFRENGEKLPKTLSKPKWIELPQRCCEKPILVALDWNEDYIEWLVDGKAVRRQNNERWHNEMWVQFDCETMGNWFGVPDTCDARLPATFRVYYVRAWQKI